MTLTSKIQQHLFFSATTNKSCSAKVKKKMDHRNHLTSKLHSQALNSKTNVTALFKTNHQRKLAGKVKKNKVLLR